MHEKIDIVDDDVLLHGTLKCTHQAVPCNVESLPPAPRQCTSGPSRILLPMMKWGVCPKHVWAE